MHGLRMQATVSNSEAQLGTSGHSAISWTNSTGSRKLLFFGGAQYQVGQAQGRAVGSTRRAYARAAAVSVDRRGGMPVPEGGMQVQPACAAHTPSRYAHTHTAGRSLARSLSMWQPQPHVCHCWRAGPHWQHGARGQAQQQRVCHRLDR